MKCKKTIIRRALCFMIILVLCLPAAVFADSQEQFTLRAGYWPGYGMTGDENGSLSGYTYDYITEIARFNNWNVEFIPCGWAEGMELLRQGKLDLFGPMEWTKERADLYDYPLQSMGEEFGALYVHEKNNTIFYEDAHSLNGKTLGTMENNYFTKDIGDYCAKNQIAFQVVTIDDTKKLNAALSEGSIDLQAAGSMQLPDNAKIVLRLSSADVFYPTGKGNKYVLDGINKALSFIQSENPYYNLRLYEKHYSLSGAEKKAFTAGEADFVSHAPTIRIGYEATGRPMEYYDEESRSAKGITVDLLKKVSEYSGLQFEFVKTDSMEQALQLIDNGEIQLVSGLLTCGHFTGTYHLEPTNPLLEITLAFIGKQGISTGEAGTIVALPEKWVGIRHHMAENYPEMKVEFYADMEACLEAVLNGRADGTVLNTLVTEKVLKEHRYKELTANNMLYGKTSVCVGVSMEADPVLRAIINKSAASVGDSTRQQIIYQHTLSLPYTPSVSEVVRYNIPVIFIGLLAFLSVLYLFSIRARKKLNALAFLDPLTGEINLNKFRLEAQKKMNHTDKTNALMVIDIDKFKSINDLYGYEFGDQLLVLVAKVLRAHLFPGAILCRGSADKFYMLFEFIGKDWFSEQFKQLAGDVGSEVLKNMPACNIILSSGVCIIRPQDNNIISIIDRANMASKQIKNYHESSFAFYDQSMYDRLNQMRTIENNMSASLKNEEFIVYLQPKIELTTNRISGAEALVRWQHPEKGLIQPNDFIPLFEENGFIVNLDFYVLEQVCRLLERWKKEGRRLFTISVNLSRRHLFHVDTARRLRDIVSMYDVDPGLIEVELTESAFDNCDIFTINELFDTLHSSGFTVSVDDFGAGYSSLSLLKDLPIDVLKIDKSFFDCHQSCKTDKVGILLESVISLSRRLNIRTVSEGVETEQQVNLLLQLGCDLVQGFYFARPMPIAQLETLLESGDLFGKSKENC